MRTWNGIASHLLRLAESKHRTVNRAAEAWGVGDAPWKTSAVNDYNPLSHCQCWATEQSRPNMSHPLQTSKGTCCCTNTEQVDSLLALGRRVAECLTASTIGDSWPH